MSSKILKEALIQQKEMQEETDAENPNNIVFPEEPVTQTQVDEDDDDVDNFAGFSDNHTQFGADEVCFILLHASYWPICVLVLFTKPL